MSILNHMPFLAIIIIFVVSLLRCTPAYCLENNELKQLAEQCGQDFFHVIYSAKFETSKCKKGPDYDHCIMQDSEGLRKAYSLATKCVNKYADQSREPWLWIIIECESRQASRIFLNDNPDDNVAKDTMIMLSMDNSLNCTPMPSPEGAYKQSQINKKSLNTPTNLFSPTDGAKIIWVMTLGVGYGTVHLGISASDNSFWRYVYGSNMLVEPALPEDTDKLIELMNSWKGRGGSLEDYKSH